MTLEQEQRRRADRKLPPLTPAEQIAFKQNIIDTEGRDMREAGRGTVTTSTKGTRVKDGPFKGLTKPDMQQAILSGAPVPTGKSGYVKGGPLSGGVGLTPRAAPTAPPPMFSGLTPPPAPTGDGINAQSQVAHDGAVRGAEAAAAGISRGLNDAKNGITARDANGVQFASGARIMPGQSGAQTIAGSQFGSGSSTQLPAGQRPSDPRLAAATAFAKQRQAAGVFGQIATPPAVLAGAVTKPPMTPPPVAAPPTVAAAPTPAYPVNPANAPSAVGRALIDQGPPKALSTPAAVAASTGGTSVPQNMTPAGRLAIINEGMAGLPAPTPAPSFAPATASPAFAEAQTRLDQHDATPGPVAIAKGVGTLAAPLLKTPDVVGGVLAAGGEMIGKAGAAGGKFLFGDKNAQDRLKRGVQRPTPQPQPAVIATR